MDIPPLIEISSNPAWILSLFVVFLLAFHGWLVIWKPIDEIAWKYIDYIWLGVAVIGLIGQAAQVRQTWYSSAQEISNFTVAGSLANLKRQANFAIGPSICRSFNKTENSPKNLAQLQSEYNFACGEFARITKEVRSLDKERDVGFIDLLDTSSTRAKLTDAILIDVLQRLDNDHKAFLGALTQRSEAKYKARATPVEFVLIVLSPFLLMLALALRITKVSGEIRLKRQNSAQP